MTNCKVIALTNQKGGVGKTTTTANLGVGLANQGKRVLLIDADAQANLTMALGWQQPDELPITLLTVMQSIVEDIPMDIHEGILHHEEGVDLLPSSIELSGLEVRLFNAISRENILKTYVNAVRKDYDYILIDCMPSLGLTVINSLSAADSVIIPTQSHYLSAKGLELLLQTVSKVKRQINPDLKIDGRGLPVAAERSESEAPSQCNKITETVREAYGRHIRVFNTQIPHSVRAVEASASGKSIYAYDWTGKVAQAYAQFTEEVMQLGEKQRRQTKNRAESVR